MKPCSTCFFPYYSFSQSTECSSTGKKLVVYKNRSKLTTSWELKTFLDAWVTFMKDPEFSAIVKWLKIHFLNNPRQEIFSYGSGKNNFSTNERQNFEEGSNITDRTSGVFLSNVFLVGRGGGTSLEGWYQPVLNLIPKSVYSISVFQNGRCALPPQITTEGTLHLQAGQEKCLFLNFNASLIKKLSPFFIFTESLRLPLRFKMGPALRIFTKALKIIGEDKDSDNKIFGQKPTLAYDGRDSHFQTL